jgi:hypothetical protein
MTVEEAQRKLKQAGYISNGCLDVVSVARALDDMRIKNAEFAELLAIVQAYRDQTRDEYPTCGMELDKWLKCRDRFGTH